MTTGASAAAVGARPAGTRSIVSDRRLRWLLLVLIWAASAAYLAPRMRVGWISFDDGTLAHSAERVLGGELPHRDFDEVYTGGLDYLHAAAFRAFGVSLASLRFALLAAFLLWVPAVYRLACRFTSPVAAGAVTLLALALSVPVYPASMPSWYNLFLATFGTEALLRFVDTRRRRWLFAAGVCGGLSVLVKIVGLYFIAAAMLLLVFWEQTDAAAAAAATSTTTRVAGPRSRRDRAYAAFVAASLAIFVGLLVGLVHRRMTIEDLFNFVLPGAALAAFLLRREWSAATSAETTTGARLLRLGSLLTPLVLGSVLPVALFLVPYVRSGSVDALIQGVLVAPQQRLTFASRHPQPLLTAVLALPIALHLGYVPGVRRLVHGGVAGRALLAILLGAALAAASRELVFYGIWLSMFPLVPLTVLAGTYLLLREGARIPVRRQCEVFALLGVTAVCGLVQFPFYNATYFCYVAPLLVVTVLAVVTQQRPVPVVDGAIVLSFYLLFALLRVHPTMTRRNVGDDTGGEWLPLDTPRGGGIVMRPWERDQYQHLATALRDHARGGYTFASPDCPEVYFLSGLRNPTRTIFDFFDASPDRTPRILALLETHDVRAVALNQDPRFSPKIEPALDSALAVRYPESERIGHFLVRWRP